MCWKIIINFGYQDLIKDNSPFKLAFIFINYIFYTYAVDLSITFFYNYAVERALWK